MPNALDGRPLLSRLGTRIQKYSGCTTVALATDIALHRQSVEEIIRLAAIQAELVQALRGLLIIAPEQTPEEFNYTSAARAALAKATQ